MQKSAFYCARRALSTPPVSRSLQMACNFKSVPPPQFLFTLSSLRLLLPPLALSFLIYYFSCANISNSILLSISSIVCTAYLSDEYYKLICLRLSEVVFFVYISVKKGYVGSYWDVILFYCSRLRTRKMMCVY